MLSHDVAGVGDLILFLHGGFSNRRIFGYQLLGLSRSHRVAAVDLPGYGESPWDPGKPWFDQAVEAVASTIDGLASGRPTVVGWSLGGCVAAEVASRMDHVQLVLVGTRSGPISDETAAGMRRLVGADFPRYARSLVRAFAFASLSIDTENWLFDMALAAQPDVVLASLLGTPPLPPLGPGTVIIHGDHDQVVHPDERPRAEGPEYLFEGSGHVPFLEEKDRFNSVIAHAASS